MSLVTFQFCFIRYDLQYVTGLLELPIGIFIITNNKLNTSLRENKFNQTTTLNVGKYLCPQVEQSIYANLKSFWKLSQASTVDPSGTWTRTK
jgi:hypothetical protein